MRLYCYGMLIVVGIWLACQVSLSDAANKYSKEMNLKDDGVRWSGDSEDRIPKAKWTQDSEDDERPFRMQKLNLIWQKAKKNIGGQKLKSLRSDLKIQDKEEMTLKKLKAEGGDKDGLREAQVRQHLQNILEKYELVHIWEHDVADTAGKKKVKARENSKYMSPEEFHDDLMLFKDKKLEKLWRKAEKAGFTEEQLNLLKEELDHHQQKIDQYHEIMEHMTTKEQRAKQDAENYPNSIDRIMELEESIDDNVAPRIPNDIHGHQKVLKNKHKEIKEGYEELRAKVAAGPEAFKPDPDGFSEDPVRKLWSLAKESNFAGEELESLREELTHFERRIKKLRHYEGQLESEVLAGKKVVENDSEGGLLHSQIKSFRHKVDKIHADLEQRIMSRSEL